MSRLWVCLLAACLLVSNLPADQPLHRMALWSASSETTSAEDLAVRIDGQPARIVKFKGPSDDLMLLVVLDLVGDLAAIDLARKALITSIESLPPNAFVALLRAQDGLRVLQDPTPDHTVLADTIRALPVSGRAGLLDTVEAACRLADSIIAKAPTRLAVLYVTDSNVYNYREDFTNPVINYSDHRDLSRRFPEGLVRERISRLSARLSLRRSPLFVTHLSYRADRLNEAYQNGLLQLAATTGGNAVFCRSYAEITDAIERTFQTIRSHYSLDLEIPGRAAANAPVAVEGPHGPYTHRARIQLREK